MFGVATASWGMRFISDCNIRRGNAWMYITIRTNMCTHILSVHCCSHIRPCKYRGSAGGRINRTDCLSSHERMKYSTIYVSYVGYVIGIFAHLQFTTTIGGILDKCMYVQYVHERVYLARATENTCKQTTATSKVYLYTAALIEAIHC